MLAKMQIHPPDARVPLALGYRTVQCRTEVGVQSRAEQSTHTHTHRHGAGTDIHTVAIAERILDDRREGSRRHAPSVWHSAPAPPTRVSSGKPTCNRCNRCAHAHTHTIIVQADIVRYRMSCTHIFTVVRNIYKRPKSHDERKTTPFALTPHSPLSAPPLANRTINMYMMLQKFSFSQARITGM